MTERLLEIKGGWSISSVAFRPDGKYVVAGSDDGTVRVRNVVNGAQVKKAMIGARRITVVAVSKNGRWIVGGTECGSVKVWDAMTHKEMFWTPACGSRGVDALDVSPDSKSFATGSTGSGDIWDIQTGRRLLELKRIEPANRVLCVKFCPKGDRIATAEYTHSNLNYIRIYASDTGQLLVDIPYSANFSWSTGTPIVWSKDGQHIFAVHRGAIKQLEAATGAVRAEWQVQGANTSHACLAVANNGKFLVYCAHKSVSLWDTSTHTKLGPDIAYTGRILSVAISPDNSYLASGQDDCKFTIRNLRDVLPSPYFDIATPFVVGDSSMQMPDNLAERDLSPQGIDRVVSQPGGTIYHASQIPFMHISEMAFKLWAQGELRKAETIFTQDLTYSVKQNFDALANRALLRARLRLWKDAKADAEKSIKVQPSIIGLIAKSVALIGEGKVKDAYRAFDLTLGRCGSNESNFLLLIKSIIVYEANDFVDAVSRVNDLIASVDDKSIYYAVLAQMYTLLGESYMAKGEYENAIQSFKQAQVPLQYSDTPHLKMISLLFGWKFDHLWERNQRNLCEALHAGGSVKEAMASLRKSFPRDQRPSKATAEWITSFTERCAARLESLGDAAMISHKHDEAIEQYSAAFALQPQNSNILLVKRSKARVSKKSWEDALNDVEEAISLDPSYPWTYESKCAALHGAGRYTEAIEAHKRMLSIISQSRDPKVRELHRQYVNPSKTEATIRRVVQSIVRNLPRVLIDTASGRLHDKAKQVASFETSTTFKELVSSMRTHIDRGRIEEEVAKFFRYVMLSHKWEGDEPLFQTVGNMSIYALEPSVTNNKLQKFCSLVRDAEFRYAWSDTCCIDKTNHVILQESLVSMFKWYRGSALTIVYLRGVQSPSKLGDLFASIWNTRAWTYQEYVAAEVVQFYTEDWTPYLDLPISDVDSLIVNHKSQPVIIAEMVQAIRAGLGDRDWPELRPGLDHIREKLCLASTRHTTLAEDAAYSLLGIFSTSIPVIYGEGEGALGRLLGHILTGSGDVSILAWTGESSNYNSCLPAHITVFKELPTSHLPSHLEDAAMDSIVADLRSSSLDQTLAMRLYDRLSDLQPPWFAANRMKLPCMLFQLGPLRSSRTGALRIYRAMTVAFGMVEIKTTEDLSQMNALYLVHPWINALLDRELPHNNVYSEGELGLPPPFPEETILDHESKANAPLSPPRTPTPLPVPSRAQSMDRETRALRLLARLRQPFGALLFTLRPNGMEYKRVAADSMINVWMQENTDLNHLLDNVRMLDVL